MTATAPFGTLLLWLPHEARVCTQALSQMRRRSIAPLMAPKSHLYLGISHPRLLPHALEVFPLWGFTYKTIFNQIQHELESDLERDEYFALVTTPLLFGVRGKLRTFAPGRWQSNVVRVKTHQSCSQELYEVIEACSPGPYLGVSEIPVDRSSWKHWSWKVFLHTHTEENTTNDLC